MRSGSLVTSCKLFDDSRVVVPTSRVPYSVDLQWNDLTMSKVGWPRFGTAPGCASARNSRSASEPPIACATSWFVALRLQLLRGHDSLAAGNTYFLQRVIHHKAFDPYPYILLNSSSRCWRRAAAALLIAAKRTDSIASEIALHTVKNTDDIRTLLDENTNLTKEVKLATDLLDEIHRHVAALSPAPDDLHQVSRRPLHSGTRSSRLVQPPVPTATSRDRLGHEP